MNNKKRFIGKSIDAAIKEAVKYFNVPSKNISYEVISKTDGGVLSFFGYKKVAIDAWPSAKMSTLDKEPMAKKELDELISDIKKFCRGICLFLSTDSCDITHELKDDRLTLNIDNKQIADIMKKNTRLAESIEHLLRKKPRYLKRELPFRIFIDANGLRHQRENDLAEMAKDLSDKVAESKRPIVLSYKSSYDRRIIHMTLDKDEKVYTKSIGSGTNRKLMILPIRSDQHVNHQHP